MRGLLSTHRSAMDFEPIVGLAVRLAVLSMEVGACAPPDFAERQAGVGVPSTPIATGMMPTGVWR